MPPDPKFQGPTGLAEILQMCGLSLRTGQLTFCSGESSGFVYLQHGRVIHAVCGSLAGEEAVYKMLGWPPGTFTLNEEVLPNEKSIVLTWEQLIFEGARRTDESGERSKKPTRPVVSFAAMTSARVRASLPKITVILPDERPRVYELEAEYTHVGRAPGNEIPLNDPSVSNRHCIFILHGSDVILRDLNSSNGTIVNSQAISEVILQPGDFIQVGCVQMKFEPALRRPKLTQTASAPVGFGEKSELSEVGDQVASNVTLKLPANPVRTPSPMEDSAFLKGRSPISYANLPKPDAPSGSRPLIYILVGLIVVFALLGACYYYFIIIPAH